MKFDANIYSDMYKDAYGFRPRNFRPEDYTQAELDAIWETVAADCERAAIEQQQLMQEARRKFEEVISDLVEAGAKDRPTAIRWLWEAHDPERQDFDFFAYNMGLSVRDSWHYEQELESDESSR